MLITCDSFAKDTDKITVQVRADERALSVIPPIERKNLSITKDTSPASAELAQRAPPSRAAPVLLIIAGAIGVVELVKLIKELVREYYYGGVVYDATQVPPLITNDPRIPGDTIIVIARDGTRVSYSPTQFSVDVLTKLVTP